MPGIFQSEGKTVNQGAHWREMDFHRPWEIQALKLPLRQAKVTQSSKTNLRELGLLFRTGL